MLRKMASEAAARTFFSSPYFAVVGASSDPAKFGHKIFAWYTAHGLPATPINPSSPSIKVGSTDYSTLPSISALPHPTETGVSIITPPKITKKVLEEAKALGIKSVWLQPGTYDDEILGFALKEFEGGVGGEEGGTVGGEGWCVLVDGERAAKAAGRDLKLWGEGSWLGLVMRVIWYKHSCWISPTFLNLKYRLFRNLESFERHLGISLNLE